MLRLIQFVRQWLFLYGTIYCIVILLVSSSTTEEHYETYQPSPSVTHNEQHLPLSQHDTTTSNHQHNNNHNQPSSYLVLCLTDGTIVSINAWTGIHQSVISTDPLLQTNYYDTIHHESHDETNDMHQQPQPDGTTTTTTTIPTDTSMMILPGLDGRLYYKPPQSTILHDSSSTTKTTTSTLSEAPPLQELPITMSALLENPVRSCQPSRFATTNADSRHDGTLDEDQECGILTAQSFTSLLALSPKTGIVQWKQQENDKVGKDYNTRPTQSESSVLLLQRKDQWVQYVRTNDGQQLWNVSLGTYQALDFDMTAFSQTQTGTTSNGDTNDLHRNVDQLMMIDNDDDSTNDHDDNMIPPPILSSSKASSNDLLPAIIFQNDGRTLLAIHPIYGTTIWRQDIPSSLASIFGIANGQWKTIPIITTEMKHNTMNDDDETYDSIITSNMIDSDMSKTSRQQRNPTNHVDLDIYEQFLWEQRWIMLSEQNRYHRQIPKALPGRVITPPLDQIETYTTTNTEPICWIDDQEEWGVCPNTNEKINDLQLIQIPNSSVSGVMVHTNGLLVSWPIVISSILVIVVFVIVMIRYWYLYKKSQWIKAYEDENNLKTNSVTNPDSHHSDNQSSTPTTVNGDNNRINSDNDNIEIQQRKQSLLQSSDRTSSNDSSRAMDGIPLVRYSRYTSEFQELRALGKGGFGSVFQCQNTLDGRQYAIKKISIFGPSSDFQQQLHRVLREVKILAVLDHPNIVRYYTAWLEIEEEEDIPHNRDNSIENTLSDIICTSTAGIVSHRHSFTSSMLVDVNNDKKWNTNMSRHNKTGHLHQTSNINPLGWNNGLDISDNSSLKLPPRRNIISADVPTDDFLIFEESNNDQRIDEDSVTEEKSIETSTYKIDDIDQSHFQETTSFKNDDSTSVIMRRTLYIQMQLCSHKTVAEFLLDKKARCESLTDRIVDIPKALGIFLQIADAAAHVHTCGLIHRDLKPNNCFMDDTCLTVKVGDFGLSRESNSDDPSNNDTSSTISFNTFEDHTAGVGTRSYASPEQMSGSDYDSSTDVYSLGIILFELLYPMYTGMERQICFSNLRDHIFPNDWNDLVGTAFPSLKGLILEMLSRQPGIRPTAEAVARHIQSILGEFTLLSLDKKYHNRSDIILLRVETENRDNALQNTLQLIRDESSAANIGVDIVQYGMRSSTACNDGKLTSILEFAVQYNSNLEVPPNALASDLIRKIMSRPEIIKARQVSLASSCQTLSTS